MLKEFKAFAMRGNVIDLAVGVILEARIQHGIRHLIADLVCTRGGAHTYVRQ